MADLAGPLIAGAAGVAGVIGATRIQLKVAQRQIHAARARQQAEAYTVFAADLLEMLYSLANGWRALAAVGDAEPLADSLLAGLHPAKARLALLANEDVRENFKALAPAIRQWNAEQIRQHHAGPENLSAADVFRSTYQSEVWPVIDSLGAAMARQLAEIEAEPTSAWFRRSRVAATAT